MFSLAYTLNSIDEYRRNLSVYGVDAFQFSSGNLVVNSRTVIFKQVTLTHRTVNRELVHYVNKLNDRLVILIPCEKEVALVDGQYVGESQLFIRLPFETGVSKFPENFCAIHLEVSLQTLIALFSKQTHKKLLQNLANLSIRQACEYDTAPFCALVRRIYNESNNASEGYESGLLEAQLLNALRNFLLPFTEITIEKVNNTRKNAVFRALMFLSSQNHYHITVSELSKKVYCSRRTLEYAFKETLACSPKKYLKVRKLHLVRAELVGDHTKSVKEVLSHLGESNQSRFNNEYINFFGM